MLISKIVWLFFFQQKRCSRTKILPSKYSFLFGFWVEFSSPVLKKIFINSSSIFAVQALWKRTCCIPQIFIFIRYRSAKQISRQWYSCVLTFHLKELGSKCFAVFTIFYCQHAFHLTDVVLIKPRPGHNLHSADPAFIRYYLYQPSLYLFCHYSVTFF